MSSIDPTLTTYRWRVTRALPVGKLAGAVLLLAVGVAFANGDPVQLVVAVLAAAGLAGWALRDLLAPVRLAADPAGITVVSGYAGHRRLPWTTVERIMVTDRPRLGLRTELLEIDCGESIHQFSRHELGAEPAEVAPVLDALRGRTG